MASASFCMCTPSQTGMLECYNPMFRNATGNQQAQVHESGSVYTAVQLDLSAWSRE